MAEEYPKRPSILIEEYNPASMKRTRSSILKKSSITEFSQTYDYVIVFPMSKPDDDVESGGDLDQTDHAKHCMSAMVARGLEIFPYLSVQGDELYVLVRCPLPILKRFADKIDYLMKIDEATLHQTLLDWKPNPIEIKHDPALSAITPTEHIYLQFEHELDQNLYKVPEGADSPFIKSVRLKLIYALLRAPAKDYGCAIETTKLLYKKKILAIFPLHDSAARDQLVEKVIAWGTMPWDVPTYDLKEYFGEKIALYTVFLGHYSIWLIIPSIIGIVFQLVVWATLNFSSPVLPFYSLIITVWSICMLEFWKRQESSTAMRWGMSSFEAKEQMRPEYVGEWTKSHIDGSEVLFYPPDKLTRLYAFSRTVVVSFILLVLGVVAGIYVLRFSLQAQESTSAIASTVASILNAIQIQIFNMIYQIIAVKLTNNENHRTDTIYEDNLIVKLFIFQFINSYSSFFFLSFIASHLDRPSSVADDFEGQCGASTCMQPLSINLAIIFGTRLTVTNAIDILLPGFLKKLKRKKETKGVDPDRVLTQPEEDYLLMQYSTMISSIRNYADTAISYGFTLLFVTALPCATFFSLVNNYAKVKFDYYKLFRYYQRPVPTGVQDIGTWMTIFQFISVAAVITNAGLICFTMNVLDDFSPWGKLWVFIGFQWVLIFIQFIATELIDDVPEDVEIQVQRNEFIKSKVIDKVEEEEDEIEDDDNNEDEANADVVDDKRCCSCVRVEKPKMLHGRKIVRGIGQFPTFPYPDSDAPASWPAPLDRDNDTIPESPMLKAQRARKAAMEGGHVDPNAFVSGTAAVPGGPNDPPPPPPNAYY